MPQQTEQNVYTRTEYFINENKSLITGIVSAIFIIIIGFLAFKYFYLEPKDQEAQSQMFMAQLYFEQDSFRLALYGDQNYPGFLKIIDDYGMTDAANLAHYYAGVSFLHLGDFEGAIEFLGDFDGDDTVVGAVALGAMGDAYMELGKTEEGIEYYKKAADYEDNVFSSPLYLMKAAMALEFVGKFEEAKKYYQELKEKYPESPQGRDIEKYIARVEGKLNT